MIIERWENKEILYVFGGMKTSLQIVNQSIERLDLSSKESIWELIKLNISQGEWILISSQVFLPYGSQSDSKFILLGGSNNLDSVAQETCLEIEISTNETETTAIAQNGTYFMKIADSFSNRVSSSKNYIEMDNNIFVIGDSDTSYMIWEKKEVLPENNNS